MFDVTERAGLRARLVAAARVDPSVEAAALLGSAARGTEDRWSDIDLALVLAPGAEPDEVAARWTRRLQQQEVLVDHLDVRASGALYRVFLLASTLQVDLSFWPSGHFVTGGAPVEPVFGPVAPAGSPAADVGPLEQLRLGWLYALHARSALARGRSWQAVWMLEGIRNQLVGLCCRRYGLPSYEGRGVDDLPAPVRSQLDRTLVASTDPADLHRVFGVLVTLLLTEADRHDLPVPAGLGPALDEIVASAAQ